MAPGGTPTSQPALSERARRFACTACGKCCNSGPEMELSEAAPLADKFITSLHFRIWALPLSVAARGAAASNLEEHRRQLSHFSVREKKDRAKGRSLYLTISARTVDREKGRCPALVDKRCGIYDKRPLSCRAVPLHFSKPDSLLGAALDSFVRTPGYMCDTSSNAPVLLDGERVMDASVQQSREGGLALAKSDLAWKKKILSLMDDPDRAQAAGLPTYESVLRNFDAGYGSSVSMLAAWRVARDLGMISPKSLQDICEKQIVLIEAEIAHAANLDVAARLADMLSGYEAELAAARPRLPLLSPGGE
jgi:Fe-S-cluster containining protein